MSNLFLGNYFQGEDANGKPLSGGEVEFFEPGTSTPKDVYADASLNTTLGSEVTLDAAGRATLWLNGDYKVRLKNSAGVVVKTTDNINPPEDTETSSGNLIANGSFEDTGNSSDEADGWTLTAQSDGSVERITSDSYHGEASLKFTSDGSGGGQADTDAFFLVSPGRTYEVSFFLKCSVADIRNIVQVRYFDDDQQFLENSTVYDEDSANPTSWTLESFEETPPTNARFAKLRILGADQSDATAGEAKFDEVTVRTIRADAVSSIFPNVNDTVTSSDEELNKLDGYSGDIPTAGWILLDTQTADEDSSLDFTGIDGTYARYMFVIENINGASENPELSIRVTSDGGSSWISTASYSWFQLYIGGTDDSILGDNQILIFSTPGTGTAGIWGSVTLVDVDGTDAPAFKWDLAASTRRIFGSGQSPNSTAIDGVRFFDSDSADLEVGTIYLYGWKS